MCISLQKRKTQVKSNDGIIDLSDIFDHPLSLQDYSSSGICRNHRILTIPAELLMVPDLAGEADGCFSGEER